jgi:hypothetical protein
MSLYGHKQLVQESEDDMQNVDLKPFVELMVYDDISRGSDDQRKAFCESTQAQVLMEKQVLNKGTLMRLSKEDDAKRRIKLIVYQMAKEKNDPDWKKMTLYRKLWKKFRGKLMRKYANKAKRIAVQSQREYIQAARKMPNAPAKV